MMRSSITTLRRPLLNTFSSRTITSLSYGRIQRPLRLSTQLKNTPGNPKTLRFISHAPGPSATSNQPQKPLPSPPQLGPESFPDPTRPDLFYHLLKPPTPSSASLPVFALSFLHTPPPIKESKTIVGWLPAATTSGSESTGAEEAGLNDFKENGAFRELLHKAVQSALTDGIDDIQINAATQLHTGWMHIHDERNIPALGRIGDPDDILATVLVEDGKILPETYQPMPDPGSQTPILVAPTPPHTSSSHIPLTAGDIGQAPFHSHPQQGTALQPQQPHVVSPQAGQQPGSTIIITQPQGAGMMPMAPSGQPPPGNVYVHTEHSPPPTSYPSSSGRDTSSTPAVTVLSRPRTPSDSSSSRSSSSSSERSRRHSPHTSQSMQPLPGPIILTQPQQPPRSHSSRSTRSTRHTRRSSTPRSEHPGTTVIIPPPGQIQTGPAPTHDQPILAPSSTPPSGQSPVILVGGPPQTTTQPAPASTLQYPPQPGPTAHVPHTPDLSYPPPTHPYSQPPSQLPYGRPRPRPYEDPYYHDYRPRSRSRYSDSSSRSSSPRTRRRRPRSRRSSSYSSDGSSTPRGYRSSSPYSSSERDTRHGHSRPGTRRTSPYSGRGRDSRRPRPRPRPGTGHTSPYSSNGYDSRYAGPGYRRPGSRSISPSTEEDVHEPHPQHPRPSTRPGTSTHGQDHRPPPSLPHELAPLTPSTSHPTHPPGHRSPTPLSFTEGDPEEISNISDGRRTPPRTPHSVTSAPSTQLPSHPETRPPSHPHSRPPSHPHSRPPSRPPPHEPSSSSQPTSHHSGGPPRSPSISTRDSRSTSLTESDPGSRRRPGSRRHSPRRPSSSRYTATPLDLTIAEQQDQFRRLHEQLEDLHDELRASEERRESDNRRAEEHQERLLLEWEERTAQLIESLRGRPADLEHEADTQVAPVADAPAHDAASIASIRSAAVQAASQHAEDLREIVELEREELRRQHEADAEERQRLMEERDAARAEEAEAKEARIRDLEDELARLKGELEEERARRLSDEEQTRETEREEAQAHANATREQLDNITTLIHQQRDACDEKKQMLEKMAQDKEARRGKKEENEAVLMDMAAMMKFMYEEMQAKAAVREERNMSGKPDLQATVEHLTELVGQQQEVLNQLAGAWREDCQKHHQDTLDAIKDTAHEQVPFNVQGYLDEFSKALAVEVRMLLAEVGKMREERRVLQHELGELLRLRSKYGPGGEFNENWQPPAPPPAPPSEGPPPEPPMPDIRQAPPAWRSVIRGRKKKRDQQQHAQAHQMPQAGGPQQQHPAAYHPRRSFGMDPREQLQSWQPWHPDPTNIPSPLSEQPAVQPRMLVSTPESPNNPFGHSPRGSYGR